MADDDITPRLQRENITLNGLVAVFRTNIQVDVIQSLPARIANDQPVRSNDGFIGNKSEDGYNDQNTRDQRDTLRQGRSSPE